MTSKTLDVIAREIQGKGQMVKFVEIVLDGDLVSDEQAQDIKETVESYLPSHIKISIQWWSRDMKGHRWISGLNEMGMKSYFAVWDWFY